MKAFSGEGFHGSQGKNKDPASACCLPCHSQVLTLTCHTRRRPDDVIPFSSRQGSVGRHAGLGTACAQASHTRWGGAAAQREPPRILPNCLLGGDLFLVSAPPGRLATWRAGGGMRRGHHGGIQTTGRAMDQE